MSSMTIVNPNPPVGLNQPWFFWIPPLYHPGHGLNPKRIAEDGAWFAGWVAAAKYVDKKDRTFAYLLLAFYRWARVWYDESRTFPFGPQLLYFGLLSVSFFNIKLLPTLLLIDLFGLNVFLLARDAT